MNMLSPSEFDALLAHEGSRLLSILLPMTLGGPKTVQNAIRLRRLLEKAEDELVETGLNRPQSRVRLAEARALLHDAGIWRNGGKGAALFLDDRGTPRFMHVPIPLPEHVSVGRQYHLRHLLPMFAGDAQVHVLALSQDAARLFDVTRWTIAEVPLPNGTPRSFAEATRFDDPERQLQWHTGAQQIGVANLRAAVFHGQGVGTDELLEKKRLSEYCHMIAAGVQRVLARSTQPLVLAAVEPSASVYRQANHYRFLHGEYVQGNPDETKQRDLHEQVWSMMEPTLRQRLDAERARYAEAAGSGLASADLREVLIAARNGQIQTLFVREGGPIWGRFDRNAGEVAVHEERQKGDDDLLNVAARDALVSGAVVLPVSAADMPEGALVAATFRYAPVT